MFRIGLTVKKVTPGSAKKIFKWKLDKKIAGVSTVLNEIGSHAYHLCNYITGLKGKSLFADIKQYSKKLDLIQTLKFS